MCIDRKTAMTGPRPQRTRPAERGISLIELIVFIVIVSVAIAGILLVMDKVTTHSADPLILKQEIAVAESMLEEIELQDFLPASASTAVTPANRATAYHIVSDYDGFATNGIYTPDNAAVPGLGNYNLAVAVTPVALAPTTGSTIPVASAVQITVTVTNSTLSAGDPLSQTVIGGYRTAY